MLGFVVVIGFFVFGAGEGAVVDAAGVAKVGEGLQVVAGDGGDVASGMVGGVFVVVAGVGFLVDGAGAGVIAGDAGVLPLLVN